MEGRRAAGSSFEGASGDRSPSEAEKGRGSWGSIRGPEERNCTNQAVNKLTKPETCGDHDSDLKKPYPHPDLHRKKKKTGGCSLLNVYLQSGDGNEGGHSCI
jgi:hypothetical protein